MNTQENIYLIDMIRTELLECYSGMCIYGMESSVLVNLS